MARETVGRVGRELLDFLLTQRRRARWGALLESLPVRATLSVDELRRYTPIELAAPRGAPLVVWYDLAGVPFSEPFFGQTVSNRLARARAWAPVLTEPGALAAARTAPTALRPRGFVFHVSRCGSTLLANMLAALDGSLVLKEPTPVNAALSPAHRDRLGNAEFLGDLLAALGQQRRPCERNFFVKFTSWNTLFLPLFRATFPDVPVVFMYREPLEVTAANASTAIPTAVRLGAKLASWAGLSAPRPVAPHEAAGLTEAEYEGRLVGALMSTALRHTGPGMMTLNYARLSESSFRRVLEFLGIEASAEQVARAMAVTRFYSKDPVGRRLHRDDSATKRQSAGPELRAAVARWAAEPFEQLEQLSERG